MSHALPFGLQKEFPFVSRFITVAGHRMHYIDVDGLDVEGASGEDQKQGVDRPVVLLLHGNPTWSFYYRELIRELSPYFRVIAPDFLGLGLSDRTPHTAFRAKDRIEHLEEFIEKLGLERFSLVMHDWGGSIGTGMAVRAPERIERIVYLNTTLTETEALPMLIKVAATPVIGKFLTQYTKQFLRFTTGLGVFRKLRKSVKAGYYFPYRTIASRKAIWDFVDDIPFDAGHPSYKTMMDLAENISRLGDREVQIVWGLRDPCFHREMLTKVARHFPNAELVEIPEASHLVLEDAKEIALPAITTFLRYGPGHFDGEYLTRSSEHRSSNERSSRASAPSSNISDTGGVPASSDAGSCSVLVQRFLEHSERLQGKPACIEPLFLGDQVRYGHTSFREMRERIYKYQRGLNELGLAAKDRVLMLVPPGADFLALSYAVMGRGALPIFLDPGMGKENLFACIREIDPQVLIGSPRAQLLRLKKREIMPNLKFHITASDWIYTGGPKLNFLKRFSAKPLDVTSPSAVKNRIENSETGSSVRGEDAGNEPVFIAFTSGATGKPKGVVYTNTMLAAQLSILREQFGIEAGKRDLPLLPIFSLFHLAGGVCSVFPNVDPARPLSLLPERVLKIVQDLEVNYSFGSPTLWKKIADYAIRAGENFGSLEKIFMAGAPVPGHVLGRVKELLVEGEVYTPYGATEALPVTLVSSQELNAGAASSGSEGDPNQPSRCTVPEGGVQGLYVGKPIRGVQVRIVRRESLALGGQVGGSPLVPCAAREIGEILVSGENVSSSYYENEAANEKAKVSYEGRLWHRMGDAGYLSEEGGLYFCGRLAHLVEVAPQ
ncbi:alpha/beta fold hydrolase, partial [bacterium]|nr:alpha/beta fold hydrolase [bacterium]